MSDLFGQIYLIRQKSVNFGEQLIFVAMSGWFCLQKRKPENVSYWKNCFNHNNWFFLFWFLIVVWNLVVIAAERYLAVCHPFKHNEFTKRKVLISFVLIYIMAVLLPSIAIFEVSYIQYIIFNLIKINLLSSRSQSLSDHIQQKSHVFWYRFSTTSVLVISRFWLSFIYLVSTSDWAKSMLCQITPSTIWVGSNLDWTPSQFWWFPVNLMTRCEQTWVIEHGWIVTDINV